MLDSKSQTSALKPLTFNPTDFTLTHTYYTLHPTYVRPKPFTLHPTPYTLHPAPWSLNLGANLVEAFNAVDVCLRKSLHPEPQTLIWIPDPNVLNLKYIKLRIEYSCSGSVGGERLKKNYHQPYIGWRWNPYSGPVWAFPKMVKPIRGILFSSTHMGFFDQPV